MKTERDKLRAMLTILASVVILLAAPLLAADPPAAPEPVELKTLRLEYQQRLMKAQTPADEWYRMQLRTLLARYKQTGNLDAALTAQAEMENPDPTKPIPADKPLPPDLAGIRNTYIVNAQRLTQPVDGWYKQQLGSLKTALTREGRLTEAQMIDGILGVKPTGPAVPTVVPPSMDWARPASWKKPWGGKTREDDGALEFHGPGTAPFQMAFALADALPGEKATITGEVNIVTGGGFVLAATADGKDMLVLLVSKEGTRLFEMRGASIRHTGTLSSDGPKDGWQPFEFERASKRMKVRIGSSRHTVDIASGRFGRAWGLATYEKYSVSLRSLMLKAE